MFTFRIETKLGSTISLTQNESNYQVVNIDGLNPPEAEVYTSPIANMGGAKYKNSKVQMRNIVITVRIQGDVETNRLYLYRVFRSGQWCKIFYKNGSRDVYIEGYCEKIENNPFTMTEEMQISILCPQPYWKAVKTVYYDVSKELGAFTFPFSIDSNGVEFGIIENDRIVSVFNSGDVESGIIIRIKASANGVDNLKIIHENTNQYFTLATTLNEGDEVVIDTYKGEKSVMINGESAMNVVGKGSAWFTLLAGDNTFSYTADSSPESVNIVFEFNEMYEGV